MDADSIIGDITAVTKKWTRQRKAEERRAGAASRRAYLYTTARDTIKDAAWSEMKKAYLKASSGGTLPAMARQIMYAARGPIQDITGEPLDDRYFTQTLLPDYMNEHPDETANWDVVFDARGHIEEPHTGLVVPLGTLEVREYLQTPDQQGTPTRVRGLFPTCGPDNRFGAVLFIEKEGFLQLFHRVRLAERYDLAIMSTKGMSVVAARQLVDRLCGAKRIPLLVMHDFDVSGFSILGTLCRSNRRYRFTNTVRAIDLGLRLSDVEACGLESETVHVRGNSWKVSNSLRRNGATKEEITYLLEGQRVELNAFPSRDLVDWLEEQLDRHGIKKVLPDEATLSEAYCRAFVRESVRRAIPEIVQRAKAELAAEGVIPSDLRNRVAAELAKHRAMPWDRSVDRHARRVLRDRRKDERSD